MFHDAQSVPAPPPRWPAIQPRSSPIWIRIGGRWLPGHIQSWRRLPNGRWTAWISYQADPEHPTVAPLWGHFLYDPAAILDRRERPQPPAES